VFLLRLTVAVSKSDKDILVFWAKFEMCFCVGKGIIFGLCSRSQNFTISGYSLACICSPLAFIFQQLTGSNAEKNGQF